MKSVIKLLAVTTLIISSFSFAEEVPPAVHKISTQLEALGTNVTLISAVKAQNGEGLTLEAIKNRDSKWREVAGTDSFMDGLLANAAAVELLKIEASQVYFIELFLMDNQGANVAMTSKTSDYWQGDEAKWQESFKSGVGALHVGEVEFDESAQAYLVQVSVPVMEDGKAIGAITIGINLDELGE